MKNAAGRIRTRGRASKVGRLWLPINGFLGLDNDGDAGTSLSQGTPTMEPASGPAEVVSVPMTTADELHTLLPLPWDIHKGGKAAARVWFIHASTDADDAPVFKVGTKFLGKQDTVPEIKGGADVDVSITHGGTVATDDSLEVTPWTSLQWETYMAMEDALVALSLELDALGSATADECEVLGLEIAYERNDAGLSPESVGSLIMDNTL